MLLKVSAVISRDDLTSKDGVNARKSTNVVDLIKKAKLEEKKEKRHTQFLVVIALFVLAILGFIISF